MHHRSILRSILTSPFLFVTALFLLSAGQSDAQSPWTLEACINQAIENNLSLQRGNLDIEATESRLKQARLSRWPNLNASTSYGLAFGRATTPDNQTITVGTTTQNQFYNVNTNVNLFSGFSTRNNIRQNGKLMELIRMEQKALEENISLQVANAFLQVLLAKEDENRALVQVKVSKDNLANSQELVRAGIIPEGNLRDLEAQVAGDELAVINATNSVSIAKLNLQILMLVEESAFEVAVPSDDVLDAMLVTDEDWDPKAISNYAANNLPAFTSNSLAIEIEDLNVDIARAGKMPSVGLSGGLSTSWFTNGDPLTPNYVDQLDAFFGQSVGIGLTVPIFSNGTNNNNIRQAEIQRDRVKSFNQEEINTLFQTVSQAVADAQASQASYRASQAVVNAREQSLEFTEKRFNAGQATTFEFNNARNLLNSAQADAIRAKYSYIFAIKVLDYYQGRPLSF